MARQLSTIDVHYIVQELQSLINTRVDKIYNLSHEEIYFQFYKTSEGKKLVRYMQGKALFLSSKKTVEDTPSHLCMILRKHLEGMFLASIEHLKPERIVRLSFSNKEEQRTVYIELFGKGNVILCKDNIIVDCLTRHVFKDRTVAPKKEYIFPSMAYDLFTLKKEELEALLKKTTRESIVTMLATELGLGGLYSEEICTIADIPKTKVPSKIDAIELKKLHEALQSMLDKKIEPMILYEQEDPFDVLPFSFLLYKDRKAKVLASFNEALEEFFSSNIISAKKKSPYEKQIETLQRIIAEQKETIAHFEQDEALMKQKADLLYHQYAQVSEIMGQINTAAKNLGWGEVKKRLQEHSTIKDINLKDKFIIISLKE